MFNIFRKKTQLLGYSRHSAKSLSEYFEDYNLEAPLGIDIYCSGSVILKDNEEEYWVAILIPKYDVNERDEIYIDLVYTASYLEPFGGDRGKLKSGYMQTKNVPNDIYYEWVKKDRQANEQKEILKKSKLNS